MAAERDNDRGRRFPWAKVRILKAAELDEGYPYLRREADLPMLLAFVERFDRLGWLPPIDAEKRHLLAAHDVIMHVVREGLCFYEFCSKGARGERDPWLTLFFHVDARRQLRLCGVELTAFVRRHEPIVLRKMRMRVEQLDASLR
jgi:hypothetical protein